MLKFNFKHNFQIEGDENIILASGGINSWVVWVAGEQSLDIRLYHATKYTILAEINVKQCAIQKFQCKIEAIWVDFRKSCSNLKIRLFQ